MDATPEYIKMCERSVEIQALRPTGVDNDIGYTTNIFFGRFFLEKETIEDHLFGVSDPRSARGFWLPRQDQLQDIAGCTRPNAPLYAQMLSVMGFWQTIHRQFTSYEQLWLAFVMKENFGKVWSGADWISMCV